MATALRQPYQQYRQRTLITSIAAAIVLAQLGQLPPGGSVAFSTRSGVLTAVSSSIALAARGGSGTDALWSYTAPYTAASLALGVPLLVVGAVRLRNYRAYRVRMGDGFAIDF